LMPGNHNPGINRGSVAVASLTKASAGIKVEP
jgi:hypothetical protein